jgi:2Fe-2S ferredoxin
MSETMGTDTTPQGGTATTPTPFRITFRRGGVDTAVTVTPGEPSGETGRPGSILDIALRNGIDMDHACGGVCGCATCHVYVKSGAESCPTPDMEESEMLDMAMNRKADSRLGCQCVPTGRADLVVEIPS